MALAALVLYSLWFALAFGVRTLVAVRRTGDRGFRGVSGAPLSLEWCAGILFVVALLVGVAASLADLAGMPPLVESRAITAAGLVNALAGIGATLCRAAVDGRVVAHRRRRSRAHRARDPPCVQARPQPDLSPPWR